MVRVNLKPRAEGQKLKVNMLLCILSSFTPWLPPSAVKVGAYQTLNSCCVFVAFGVPPTQSILCYHRTNKKKKTNTRAVHVCHWPVLQFSNGGFKLHHSELGKIFALLLHKQDEGQSGVGCITCRTLRSWYRTHTVTMWQHWLALCLSFLMAFWRSTRQSETHATFYANQLFFPTKQLLGATKRKDLFLAHWTLKSISKNWYWFVWP